MKKALITTSDNKVVDVTDAEFEVHSSCFWADCPDDTTVGMTYADGTYTAAVVTTTYVDHRKMNYPELAEQLDNLWHDIDTGALDKTGTFYTALKSVKDDYPTD